MAPASVDDPVRPFTLAIASGKGGTGKTLTATNLAMLLAREGRRVLLADCDVEAPNDHLFLARESTDTQVAEALVATVDPAACSACGACSRTCAYGAVRVIGRTALVFDELCHGCYACTDVCPTGAITLSGGRVGIVESGTVSGAAGLTLVTGTLDVGQVKAPTVIRSVRRVAESVDTGVVILDAPPGVACSAVAAVRGADALLLVTEPTPFGAHDLKLGLELGESLGLPMGVLVNRVGTGGSDIDALCRAFGVPVVARIPFDRLVAEAYATGRLAIDAVPELTGTLASLMPALEAAAARKQGVA